MLAANHFAAKRRSEGKVGAARRVFAAVAAGVLAIAGLVSVLSVATADPNPAIVVDQVTIGGGTGPEGQLVIGDTIEISGEWDASDASPREGDSFVIGLPHELNIPADVPFELTGPREGGEIVSWATCLAVAATDEVTCTLTDEVAENPELVLGAFSFDVEAVAATTEAELVFDLNGADTPVALPGGGGIDDGIVLPDSWGKTGEMNSNNWSMSWSIELPGSRMAGEEIINIADTLGAGHQLCDPSLLKVETVRGGTVVDVTSIAELIPGVDAQNFTIRLTAPDSGFDSNVTYRITYDTCTPDGLIDPDDTVYENTAEIDVWGEGSGIIGVSPNPWHEELTKTGSVLGGADRNGKIAWNVNVPGNQMLDSDGRSKRGFTVTELLGLGHQVCADTVTGIRVWERYGPSNQRDREITGLLTPTVLADNPFFFGVGFDINNVDPEFEFKASDYRYLITYDTCVTQSDLPTGGTEYTNTVIVDSEIAEGTASTPPRIDAKSGSINTSFVTIDGVERLPQTTLNWNIVVAGERLVAEGQSGDLIVTDQLSDTQQVCSAGDPSGGVASQLGLKVEARDQIENGGLATVDLTDSVDAEHDGNGAITLTIPEPTLAQPGGGSATGFSQEYQYVITYVSCTTSGGMDAPGTVYGNDALIAAKAYEQSVTQNNRGSGSGQGMTRGTIAIEKVLADTPGAEFVPADTVFTVHVQELDPTGTMQIEYDLQVPLNGDPVSGPNSRGLGWTAVLTEPSFPSVPGVVFGDPVFATGTGVTVTDGGKSATAALTPGQNISVTVTNESQLGAVSLIKVL